MDLVERVKAILLTPKAEWRTIEGEPGDPGYLFANYVAILAAVPAVCGFVGMAIFGFHRVGVFGGVAFALVRYLLSFLVVVVLAVVADALAPAFGGRKNQSNALKLAVYSMTPAWLAGVFALLPGLRILSLVGLYGVYLFWLGASSLMKAPDEKSVPYTAAVVACGVVIYIVAFVVVRAIAFGAAWV